MLTKNEFLILAGKHFWPKVDFLDWDDDMQKELLDEYMLTLKLEEVEDVVCEACDIDSIGAAFRLPQKRFTQHLIHYLTPTLRQYTYDYFELGDD